MSTSALAIEAAEALYDWEAAKRRGITGRALRRVRLTYYDLRLLLALRVGRDLALRLIAREVAWPEVAA